MDLVPPDEVAPSVWRMQVPLPDGFLRFINVYLVRDSAGFALIDTGWDYHDSWSPVLRHLTTVGLAIEDCHTVIVTHGHHDHYGLAGRIRETCGAQIWLHEADMTFMHNRYIDVDEFPKVLATWLQRYGVPADEAEGLSTPGADNRRTAAMNTPDHLLQGGERFIVGRYQLEVQWTPGHTPGHVCLFDAGQQVMFCGDHILPHVSPNVSLMPYSTFNPLPGYLDSLRQVADGGIRLALPGHGEPMTDIATRAAGLLRHQLDRRDQLVRLVSDEPRTAYELAAEVWRNSTPNNWSEFKSFVRRNAVTTLIAHLELLAVDGLVRREDDAVIRFARPPGHL